jgi:putative iron-dependent peroxidase
MKTSPSPQSVNSPLTRAALFLVATIDSSDNALSRVRSFCGELSGLLRAVGFRATDAGLTCVMGIGSEAWDRLWGQPRPVELHPFREFRAENRHAISTPGDLIFHIRAEHFDLCFELGTQIVDSLGSAISVVDEVHGFRYYDARDLLGFVDGTENPTAEEAVDATLIGAEDQAFAGGSYVVVQKYLHDLAAWEKLAVEEQERIIGRKKLSNIELGDDVKPSFAHNAVTTIVKGGKEIKILRDNMPFGRTGGEFGTYFTGYSRSPATIEQMLENMFVGNPPGDYDRLLDFSRPVTGCLFFVPTAAFLDGMSA